MEIPRIYELFLKHAIVTTDSRNCPEGSLFFALKGNNFNGNQYAQSALEKGCSYAIVDEPEFATNERIILVDDCLVALQQLANYHRRKLKTPIIGITGTNGKTTTKELVAAVLAKEFNVAFTQGNLNNHIGVPLTLLKLTPETEIAVVEMGANHVGEIKMLAEIAEPNFGLITNVGRAHLEGFGSFDNIVKTKTELYDFIRNKKNGKLFVDIDNPILKEKSEGITSVSYGTDPNAFLRGRVVSNNPFIELEWTFLDNSYQVQTNLIGEYNFSNVMAAIAVGKFLGVKADDICDALAEYRPTNNRSQLKKTGSNTLIVDAYNANPTSMFAALTNFNQIRGPKKAVILGDMLELGEESDDEHEKVIDFIEKSLYEKVYLVGSQFKKLSRNAPAFLTVEEMIEVLKKDPLSGYTLLVKGSHGIHLEKCIDVL
ncbi:MAG: UDP-N-acetylmuramyl pentapeptide synthase [Bacteroidetes bacterium]|jgi:UDP-N-acetylmuramoyl-tripeptide--D-alanyl-D-alanine ligase|nr:UDP-N-acetylmuramyl pentapeptide synthase [Bacteroidota bacterium]